jgi:hypothetical protein
MNGPVVGDNTQHEEETPASGVYRIPYRSVEWSSTVPSFLFLRVHGGVLGWRQPSTFHYLSEVVERPLRPFSQRPTNGRLPSQLCPALPVGSLPHPGPT